MGKPARELNIADLVVDQQVASGRGDVVALRFIDQSLARQDLTYAELASQTARFAGVMRSHGIPAGSLVYVLAPRLPLAYVAMLGALRAGCAIAPLFSSYGPEPIRQRLAAGPARVLITTAELYLTKVADQRPAELEHVWLIGPGAEQVPGRAVASLASLMASAGPRLDVQPTHADDLAIVHFTSGTTGRPKGAAHVHEAVLAHRATGASVLGIGPGDVAWCTADPGWVTGTSYGLLAPLACGATSLIDAGEFDPRRWMRILEQERVQVWYTSPTALRMIRGAGDPGTAGRDLGRLRHVASVGEPLNPEVIDWGQQALGHLIHDTWWQTETGSIMIANRPGMPVRRGSMGWPVEGIEVALVRHGPKDERLLEQGAPVLVDEPGTSGEIAIRAPWPSMMRAYLNEPERYAACFAGGWYLSGDLASMDEDGYLWFVGRGDDVIKTAGHLVGPFEVESVLLEHPAVAEAGVVGIADPLIGEAICACLTLRPGMRPSTSLGGQIKAFARQRLGAAVAPRRIEFVPSLPHTPSGKILRRELRDRLAAAAGSAP